MAGENKGAFYRGIVEELRKAGDWRSKGMYLRLIVEKNDLPELMEYVRAYPVCRVINRYKKIAGASRQAKVVSRLKTA